MGIVKIAQIGSTMRIVYIATGLTALCADRIFSGFASRILRLCLELLQALSTSVHASITRVARASAKTMTIFNAKPCQTLLRQPALDALLIRVILNVRFASQAIPSQLTNFPVLKSP